MGESSTRVWVSGMKRNTNQEAVLLPCSHWDVQELRGVVKCGFAVFLPVDMAVLLQRVF
jgi:hypothetical protein